MNWKNSKYKLWPDYPVYDLFQLNILIGRTDFSEKNLVTILAIVQVGVIKYSPFLSVVPYFSENFPLYLINTPFPNNFRNPAPYRHPFPKCQFEWEEKSVSLIEKNRKKLPKIRLYLITAPLSKNSQSPVPYRRPLPVPYWHPLTVTYKASPCSLK